MRKILLLVVAILLTISMQAEADLTLLGQGTSADGTWNLIYDSDSDITWYDYTKAIATWQDQMAWADALSVNFGDNVYDDWRLPVTFDQNCYGYNCTNSEMGNLFYKEFGNSAGNPLIDTGDFQNLVSSNYWSSSDFTVPGDYYVFVTVNGYLAHGWAGSKRLGIAVRPGRVVMPEPAGNAGAVLSCPSGMLSYWSFDKCTGTTAYDSVGNNDGTVYGADWADGQVGSALYFSGKDSYVDMNSPSFGTKSYTICSWINVEALSGQQTILHYTNQGEGEDVGWRVYPDGTLGIFDENNDRLQSKTSIVPDTWNHVCATLTPASANQAVFEIYLNGRLDNSRTNYYMPWGAYSGLTIGSKYELSQYFHGFIDEVAIYNRVLTASEIQQSYQNGLYGTGYCEEVRGVACVGFESPMDNGPVTVKKNRVVPLKAQLLNADGSMVTDHDIAASPVFQVNYDSCIEGDAVDVTDDIRSDRKGKKSRRGKENRKGIKGTRGNQFVFNKDSNWQYNVNTKNFTAKGTYTLSIVTGDDSEYIIVPSCEATFVVE